MKTAWDTGLATGIFTKERMQRYGRREVSVGLMVMIPNAGTGPGIEKCEVADHKPIRRMIEACEGSLAGRYRLTPSRESRE